MERTTREMTRKDGFLSNQEMEETFKDLAFERNEAKPQKLLCSSENKANPYLLPSDSEEDVDQEDVDDEEEVNAGVDHAAALMKKLNLAARGMNSRVKDQNKVLDRLADKVSRRALTIVQFDS